jgi:hypothetical protein
MPRFVLCATLACAGTAAFAAPTMHATGPIRHACGGVGAGERAQMKALAREANLELLFVTQKRGGYLADVALSIVDAKGGELLHTTADGPICMLALPAGRYLVRATYNGVQRSARVDGGGAIGTPRRVALAFPGGKWDGIRASDEEKASARAP